MTAVNTLVKPVTCPRCKGAGFLANQRVVYAGAPGTCFQCAGAGVVEGDRATLAAARAAKRAYEAGMRAYHAWEQTQWSTGRASEALRGLWLLQGCEPDRYEKAMTSIINRHPGVEAALAGYFEADRAATRARWGEARKARLAATA